MTPMEVLLRRSSDEASLRAMTDGLRRKQDIAHISQLSGDPVLMNFGTGYGADATRQSERYVDQQEASDQRAMTQGYYDQLARQHGENLEHQRNTLSATMARNAETERHNRAQEDIALFNRTQRNPTQSVMNKAEEVTSTLNNLDIVASNFRPEFASEIGFGEGTISNYLGSTPMGSDAQKDQARWWSEYRRVYELGARNQLFGSALTDTEKQAWEQANIGPNSPPDVIERGLRSMQEVARRKAMQVAEMHIGAGYRQDWLQATYGPLFDPQPGAAPQKAPEGGALGGAPNVVNWADL